MKTNIQKHGRHTIVLLEGEVEYFNITQLKDFMKPLINQANESVIVDLSDVTFMDSSGIGLLVTCHKKMMKYDHHFALLNVPKDVMTLLRLGTIDKFLTIYSSMDDIPD